MTDAFMTAAVLAAVATGTTRILGVANQRVKECNRIQVMQTELSKCGVICRELADGIEIEGAGGVANLRGAVIKCHDDHRIAMSFAVLGCLLPDLIITEKECVEKTYPEYWDHLRLCLGAKLASADSHPEEEALAAGSQHCILIGMRGAGKTTMGKELARRMGRAFVDMDDVAVAELKMPIADFVKSNGWPSFREKESELFSRTIRERAAGTVISCGGGIVETESCRDKLKAARALGHIVLHVQRDIADVEAYLTSDPTRPPLPEAPAVAWARREPLYNHCCSHEFVINLSEDDMSSAHNELFALVERITRRQPAALLQDTVTISLTYPDLRAAATNMPEIEKGADVLEMRVDLLDPSLRGHSDVRAQFAQLRRMSTLPIIWTVRSKGQGGAFEGSEEEMVALLQLGVRLGCEFVDVEGCWSTKAKAAILDDKRGARIITSYHDFTDKYYTAADLAKVFSGLHCGGKADVVKVAIKTPKPSSITEMDFAIMTFREANPSTPAVGLCMGAAGKLSRVSNKFLTFSTHPLLPGKAAPGQLTAEEIRRLKIDLGMLPPDRKFFLFGSPIAKSASPAMHNAAFKAQGLTGWVYDRCETTDVAVALATINAPDFGGGSITMPLKEELLPHMSILTDSARRIGAVNTITTRVAADGSRVLVGDNTDWVAIHRLVEQRVAMRRLRTGGGQRALLVGAGGTAKAAIYALSKVKGIQQPVLIYNRTTSRAESLAAEFGAKVITSLEGLENVGVIVSTIPPEGATVIPDSLLLNQPIMLDASYMPGGAPLSNRAKAAGCDLIVGPHMLFEQATYQNERWTGRKALRGEMANAICKHFGPDSGLSTILAHELKT